MTAIPRPLPTATAVKAADKTTYVCVIKLVGRWLASS